MDISSATLNRMGGSLIDALGLDVDTQLAARRQVGYELDLAASLLPNPEAWAVLGRCADATLYLLAGNVLLGIARERPSAEEDLGLVVTCHRARVTEVRYRRKGRETFWSVQFRDRKPLTLEGQIDPQYRPGQAETETFDQVEVLARALARKAGWQIADPANG